MYRTYRCRYQRVLHYLLFQAHNYWNRILENTFTALSSPWVCCGATGRRTALEAGRWRLQFPMVSLEFFIDSILPAAVWHWGRVRLWQKWIPGIFPGGKGGRCVGMTLPPSCADYLITSGSLKFLETQGPAQTCNGIVLPFVLSSPKVLNLISVPKVLCDLMLICWLEVKWHRFERQNFGFERLYIS
jgi:hypothetical protein